MLGLIETRNKKTIPLESQQAMCSGGTVPYPKLPVLILLDTRVVVALGVSVMDQHPIVSRHRTKELPLSITKCLCLAPVVNVSCSVLFLLLTLLFFLLTEMAVLVAQGWVRFVTVPLGSIAASRPS